MKKIAMVTALCFAGTSAFAGAMGGKMADPVVEEPVMVPEAPVAGKFDGGAGLVVGGLALAALAVAVASGSSSTATTTE